MRRTPISDPDNSDYWISSSELHGSPNSNDIISDVSRIKGIITNQFQLYQNYPNPFNPTTTITYEIAERGKVELLIYDILGREVEVLENKTKDAGFYQIQFDASNYSSGVYFYKLRTDNKQIVKKLAILK